MVARVAQPDVVTRLLGESLIGMAEAGKLYAVVATTAARHAKRGIQLADGRTVRLESLRTGRKLKTSEQAVRRFLEALKSEPLQGDENQPRSPSATERAAAEASAELDVFLGGK